MEEGLLIERAKKSKSQIIVWTERLRKAVKAAQNMPGVSWQRYLIHNITGQKIPDETFSSAWQRLMKRAIETGLKERFTFHDLKAKGVSDFDGDKKIASGHRTDAMVDVYDRKPAQVQATK